VLTKSPLKPRAITDPRDNTQYLAWVFIYSPRIGSEYRDLAVIIDANTGEVWTRLVAMAGG
jgi:hypothetical protein